MSLSTEASQRFERGVDPNGVVFASNRAAALMAEIAGGTVITGLIDRYPSRIEPKKISVRPARINHLLGTSLPVDVMTDILNRLELTYNDQTVTVPTFRPDIEREVDVIEEVARINNYDTIPVADTSFVRMDTERNSTELFYDLLKSTCCEIGLSEAITNSMISKKEIEAVNDHVNVTILNPISDDMNAMRPSLLPGLLKVAAYNINRQQADFRFFELGRIFGKNAADNPDDQAYSLAFLIHGGRYGRNWGEAVQSIDFYDIKGIVEQFCDKISLDNLEFILYDRNGYYRPERALSLNLQGQNIGSFGQIKPEVASVFGIESDVYGFDLNISGIEHLIYKNQRYQPFSRYPAIEKDLALIVGTDIAAGKLRSFILKTGYPLAREIIIFDIFHGGHLGEGKKSIGFRIRFQSKERTLTDKEVSQIFDEIIKQVERKFNAKLRE
jgi:phenylalanyl-tRNA synthetase beta chain